MTKSLRTDVRVFRQPSMRRHAPRDERPRPRYGHSFLPRDATRHRLESLSHVHVSRRMLSDLADETGHTNHSEPAVDTSTSDDHSPEGHPISPSAGQLRCSICQGTFRRPEHLKRHYRSHTKEKPFECLKCGRCFSRTYV